jgi:hypothetical protein
MTQYLLSVYVSDSEMAAIPEDQIQKMYAQVDEFNAEVQAAGAWVFGGGLHPSSSATVVRVQDGDLLTTDGPFVETKEYLGGFWIIEAADLDAALAWAAKGTAACMGPVEVRPFQDDPGTEADA